MNTLTRTHTNWKIGDFYFYGTIIVFINGERRKIPYKIIEKEEVEDGFKIIGHSLNGEKQPVTTESDLSHMSPCTAGEAQGFADDFITHLTARAQGAMDGSLKDSLDWQLERAKKILDEGWITAD